MMGGKTLGLVNQDNLPKKSFKRLCTSQNAEDYQGPHFALLLSLGGTCIKQFHITEF